MRLAAELGKLPNTILIEGHTDAKPFAGGGEYSNWELSADRANSSRRLMQNSGLHPGQLVQVRGFADQHLRTPDAPDNPANRRISVIVRYLADKAPTEAAQEPASENKTAHPEPPAAPAPHH